MTLNETIAELGEAFDGFKAAQTKRLDALEVQLDRASVGGSAVKTIGTFEQREHADLFTKWLRKPKSAEIKSQLEGFETKTASGLSDSAGGAMVPELILNTILRRVKDGSAMRRIAGVNSVGSSDIKMILSNNDADSGWVGELDTRTTTDEPTVTGRAPTFGTVYSYVKASEELIMDGKFDIQSWFVDSVSDEVMKQEGAAFISGNGTNKPTGLLNSAPESAGDSDSPARAVAAFKYIPTGDASGFGSLATTSPEFYPADVLYTTVYDLKAQYRRNSVWLMNSATAGTVRKFKDADGRYLWTDGLAAGQAATLCGFPVVIDEGMPDIGANAHPVLFGDFRRGYGIFDLGGMRITIDDNITSPGLVKFYLRKRVGGCVLDNNAVRAVKCAAS